MSNYRWIKTKIDEDHAYVLYTSCYYCPHLLSDSIKGLLKCNKFADDTNNNVVVRNTNIKKYLSRIDFKEIGIPTWCALSEHMNTERLKKSVVYKEDGIIIEYSSPDDIKPIIVPDQYLAFKENTDILTYNDYYHKRQERKLLNENTPNSLLPVHVPSDNQIPFTYITTDVCSMCGKSKENVDRNINDGMCEDCIKQFTDIDTIKKARINNFRIKRNGSWTNKEYKLVKSFDYSK